MDASRLLPGVTLLRAGRWVGTDEPPPAVSLEEALASLPRFRRVGFGSNRHLDVVVREPLGGEPDVPVAVVSKRYALVPHAEVLSALVEAARRSGLDPAGMRARVELTEYGERMLLLLEAPPGRGLDAGDGQPVALTVVALNSVDGSSRLAIVLAWMRLACLNGLLVGSARERLARAHTGGLEVAAIRRFLDRGLRVAEAERADLRAWGERRVTAEGLRDWVDGPVRRKWGVTAAARVFHAASQGLDVGFVPPLLRLPPSERAVRPRGRVPGAAVPARTAWDAAQALSWVASRQPEPADRLTRWRDVPGLVAELLRHGTVPGGESQAPLFR